MQQIIKLRQMSEKPTREPIYICLNGTLMEFKHAYQGYWRSASNCLSWEVMHCGAEFLKVTGWLYPDEIKFEVETL